MRFFPEFFRARALPERIGDAIAGFAGSMLFIVLHLLWFGGWVVINLRVLHGVRPFDPYPFTFLTFCVSLEAIILSSFVLISQNHMSRQADERAQLDLQINLLAEQESTKTLQLLQQLCSHLGLESEPRDSDATELAQETQPGAVARAVQKELGQ